MHAFLVNPCVSFRLKLYKLAKFQELCITVPMRFTRIVRVWEKQTSRMVQFIVWWPWLCLFVTWTVIPRMYLNLCYLNNVKRRFVKYVQWFYCFFAITFQLLPSPLNCVRAQSRMHVQHIVVPTWSSIRCSVSNFVNCKLIVISISDSQSLKCKNLSLGKNTLRIGHASEAKINI